MNKILNSVQLVDYINEVGFLPLLSMGLNGWSAEEQVDEECRYTVLPDGGWEWPLWEWKGPVIQESGCAYGKFFDGKAAFVSRQWWPHLCNWRRSQHPSPSPNSIEAIIMETLHEHGSLITRELRGLCGFSGPKMRGKFDGYITRLQAAGYIVTEDFVYARDRHGHRYGWGLSLLTTPEQLFGREACDPGCTAQESRELMLAHFDSTLPQVPRKWLEKHL